MVKNKLCMLLLSAQMLLHPMGVAAQNDTLNKTSSMASSANYCCQTAFLYSRGVHPACFLNQVLKWAAY